LVLTRNHRQELLCRAWILAVAARCGLGFTFRDFDYGIDVTLHSITSRGRRWMESGFKLDIQAKSTSTRNVTDTKVLYDLDVIAYDDLRDPEVGCPRILVVLLLPDNEEEWTDHSEERLLIRHAAYWISLRGAAASGNRKTVRVPIPRSNLFTPSALNEIMDRIRRREPL
jgi:hypothetical protein